MLSCVQAGRYCFAVIAVLVRFVNLGFQIKVQRGAFFSDLRVALAQVKREPPLMKLSMILLAAGCVALSFAVITGFNDPWLVGEARDVLSGGTFGGRP